MSDVTVCLRWLKSTFLYTRIKRNPSHYKLSNALDERALETHLKKLLMQNLRKLSEAQMIRFGDDGMGVQPLRLGTIMARCECPTFGAPI